MFAFLWEGIGGPGKKAQIQNQPWIILEPPRPSRSPIMHMLGIAAEKALGVHLCRCQGFIGTANADTLHCDSNQNFILLAQMLPISKDNRLLQEAKWNEIHDLDVGSTGSGGWGGRRWIGKTLMGFCVSSRFQKYLAHWKQFRVQLRANDGLQSVSRVVSHTGVSAISFTLCLCVCPLSQLYVCF